mgnify:CR=1 FL=1
MPKRKQKKYKKPKRAFDKVRIEEENRLIKKYGLKNKKEIWKADSAVDKLRKQAKFLLTKSSAEQEQFINRLKKRGFRVESIADVLSLGGEDYLKRRLQSIVVSKKLASTPKQARQFIVHKHIMINGRIVSIPSYFVPLDEENKISLNLVKKEKSKPKICLLYTSPSPRDLSTSRMPSSA